MLHKLVSNQGGLGPLAYLGKNAQYPHLKPTMSEKTILRTLHLFAFYQKQFLETSKGRGGTIQFF